MINPRPAEYLPHMKAVVMAEDTPQFSVEWNKGDEKNATFTMLTEDFYIKIPYNLRSVEVATFAHFMEFLESRSVPRNRVNLEQVLEAYGLSYYDPMGMCFKTYGRSPTDHLWIDWNDSGYHWRDICIKPYEII